MLSDRTITIFHLCVRSKLQYKAEVTFFFTSKFHLFNWCLGYLFITLVWGSFDRQACCRFGSFHGIWQLYPRLAFEVNSGKLRTHFFMSLLTLWMMAEEWALALNQKTVQSPSLQHLMTKPCFVQHRLLKCRERHKINTSCILFWQKTTM